MKYTLPDLPYSYNALEPYYEERTLRIHHTKHHQGYVNKSNTALQLLKEARESKDFSKVKHYTNDLSFNLAGHEMHSLFWRCMRKGSEDNAPNGSLLDLLEANFGSFEAFKNHFISLTVAVEGSGWGVLAKDDADNLFVFAVKNHQNAIVPGYKPLLVCDVWEHAYYLQYQNKRKEWVDNFFPLINWDFVEKRAFQ